MFIKIKDDTRIDGYFMLKKHIVESIKYLATPGEQQLSLQPDFVYKTDEIASSLNDWLLMYDNGLACKKEPLFTDYELNLILELNNMFNSFDQSDWTETAVKTSKKWEEVRKYAKYVLITMGIEYSFPDRRSV